MRQSTRSSRDGGSHEEMAARSEDAGVYLPTEDRRKSSPCRRFGVRAVQFALHLHVVAFLQVLRVIGRLAEADDAVPPGTYGSPSDCLPPVRFADQQRKAHCCLVTIASLCGDDLQRVVSVESHFSRIYPAITRSLASVLILRPAALGLLLRLRRPSGLGIQRKIPPKEQAKFSFGASTERHAFGLGSRAPRVASRKSVPSDIRANTNQEKNNGTLRKQNHSEGLPR